MNPRQPVKTESAPAAIGPYSQGVVYGDLLFCSGAIPLHPGDGTLVDESRAAETSRCLQNLEAVCEAGGAQLSRAVRITVYTTDLASFEEINAAYAEFFDDEPPARVAIGVAALPKGAQVEIDAVVPVG